MTTSELIHTATPKDYNIVTDSPFLIPLYDNNDVFVWEEDEQEWINPDIQTYGCDYSIILDRIFKIKQKIPSFCLDGKVTNCMGEAVRYE